MNNLITEKEKIMKNTGLYHYQSIGGKKRSAIVIKISKQDMICDLTKVLLLLDVSRQELFLKPL